MIPLCPWEELPPHPWPINPEGGKGRHGGKRQRVCGWSGKIPAAAVQTHPSLRRSSAIVSVLPFRFSGLPVILCFFVSIFPSALSSVSLQPLFVTAGLPTFLPFYVPPFSLSSSPRLQFPPLPAPLRHSFPTRSLAPRTPSISTHAAPRPPRPPVQKDVRSTERCQRLDAPHLHQSVPLLISLSLSLSLPQPSVAERKK